MYYSLFPFFQDKLHLISLPCLRICLYDEDAYVDITERNFRKSVKNYLQRQPRMKLKIMDEASPEIKPQSHRTDESAAKKELLYIETVLKFKEKESKVKEKTKAVEPLNNRYITLSSDMNTNIWRDKSKRICHN